MTPLRRRDFLTACMAAPAAAAFPQQTAEFHACPKSRAPARTMCAFRAGDLTSFAADLRLTLSCLQGLANREQPRLYLIHDRYDELWLEWLKERGDIDRVEWLEIGQVFERFLPLAGQMYITDPAVPASVNVATMLAGVRNGIVATPNTADQFPLPAGAIPDSSRTGLDLRTLGWKRDLDAYRWAFSALDGDLSRQAIALLSPREAALRDYLAQFRIPILWINGPDEADELRFAREILLKWPPNIPCLGWMTSGDKEGGIPETPGMRLLSSCAKYSACTAFDAYSPTVGNLSVHSGTTARLHQPPPATVRLQRDKIYIAFIRSDGDGWNFHRHYYRKLFDDPKHGVIPIGWQIAPTALDGHPDIIDYYYRHARPGDCFVNALTGMGYIHEDDYASEYPPEERERIWKEYVEMSAAYRKRLDTTVLATYSEMQPQRLESLARSGAATAIFANYGRSRVTTPENLVSVVGGVPVFRAMNRPPGPFTFTPSARRDAEAWMLTEIRRWTPPQRPAFVYAFLANWFTTMDMGENLMKGLGGEYVAVRPDQLATLYREFSG